MMIYKGGVYNGFCYSTLYDPATQPDRTNGDLVGHRGISEDDENPSGEYMLWFLDGVLQKAERYFPKLDKTVSELSDEIEFDEEQMESTDTETYEGIATYKGKPYAYHVCCCDDYPTWRESVAASIGLDIEKALSKTNDIPAPKSASLVSTVTLRIHGDSVTIEEDNAEPVTTKISDDSLESVAWDIGEAVKDYLNGLG